jgi:hypothetical protein
MFSLLNTILKIGFKTVLYTSGLVLAVSFGTKPNDDLLRTKLTNEKGLVGAVVSSTQIKDWVFVKTAQIDTPNCPQELYVGAFNHWFSPKDLASLNKSTIEYRN